MVSKLLKKSKIDSLVAARVPSKIVKILKNNNINISLAIRDYLIDLSSEMSDSVVAKKKSA